MLKLKHINTQDFKNLLFSVSSFPYFGAIASLLNAVLELRDIYQHFLNIHIYKNDIKIKNSIYRCMINFLLGFVNFFPFFIIFSWMFINPFIIPLISFSLVAANFYRAYTTFKTIEYELSIDKFVLNNKKDSNSITIFKQSEENLYAAQRELMVIGILTLGSLISAMSILCPPLFLVGIGIGITASLLGVFDKKFLFGKSLFKVNERKTSNDQHNQKINPQQTTLNKFYFPARKILKVKQPYIDEKKFAYDIFTRTQNKNRTLSEKNNLEDSSKYQHYSQNDNSKHNNTYHHYSQENNKFLITHKR